MDGSGVKFNKSRQNMMRDKAVDTKAVAPRLNLQVARRFISRATNIRFDDKPKEATTSKCGNVGKPDEKKPIPQRGKSVSQPSPPSKNK